jgi:hypothetical protein
MIKRGRAAGLDIFRIAQQATAVYSPASSSDSGVDDADGPPGGAAAAAAAAAGGGSSAEALAGLSDADIEAMDAASLRRLLLGRGLPASGKISKLRERLREARDAGQ